jgi:hypothetical protein
MSASSTRHEEGLAAWLAQQCMQQNPCTPVVATFLLLHTFGV